MNIKSSPKMIFSVISDSKSHPAMGRDGTFYNLTRAEYFFFGRPDDLVENGGYFVQVAHKIVSAGWKQNDYIIDEYALDSYNIDVSTFKEIKLEEED